MKKFGVLVVDDSSFMRRCISILIEKDPHFFTIGIARNGIDAVDKVQRLKPDIVIMDIEMPEIDGLKALEKIMKVCPVPVVIFSKYAKKGGKAEIKALELGAADFFLKADLIGEEISNEVEKSFLSRLRTIAEGTKRSFIEEVADNNGGNRIKNSKIVPRNKADLVIIGCSTGGPSALQAILPRFSQDFNIPIIVVQHMPPGFTRSLADRFNNLCKLHVKEAEDGEKVESGNIYIAPSGFQTTLERQNNRDAILKISDVSPAETLYKPSVNVILNSAAPIYNKGLLSVVLTGMGNDGLLGCKLVKECGGHIIVEAEESCVVYGMPKVVFEAGYADVQVPLYKIHEQIMMYI